MINKKGFTLIEVMTVVFIIGILASISLPFLIGYARDARNDRAKSILHIIAQGYKNFKTDFSRASTKLSNDALGNKVNIPNQACSAAAEEGTLSPLTKFTTAATLAAGSISYTDLVYCSYIPNMNYGSNNTSYNFYLGPSTNCCQAAIAANALACMIGADSGDYGSNYCAYIAESGGLKEVH